MKRGDYGVNRWKCWSILCVHFRFRCKAYHQPVWWAFWFFFSLPFAGMWTAFWPQSCSVSTEKCWRVAVGRDYFLFQTVIIMQLVFECSGYKCLPLQACVPGFLYSIIVFTSSFYWCLPSNKWLSVCSSLVRILRIYFFEADSRLVVKVTDNTENKTVLLWCYSHVISCDGCFFFFFCQHVITNGS